MAHMRQQFEAADAAVLGVGVGEVFADVAQGCCAEQGVADGVQQYIGVAVAYEPVGVGDEDAAYYERQSFAEGVNVVSGAYSPSVGLRSIEICMRMVLERGLVESLVVGIKYDMSNEKML